MSSTLPVVDGVTDVNGATLNQFEVAARKGAASGYAGLDAGGRVPDAQLPPRLAQLGTQLPGNDFNAVFANGWYWNNVSAVNAPPSGGPLWGIQVINVANNAGYCTQIAYDYAGAVPLVWKRRMVASVWESWVQTDPAALGGGVDFIGAWGSGIAYKKGDVVSYNGNDYMAVNDSTGVAPPAAASAILPPGTEIEYIPKTVPVGVTATVEASSDVIATATARSYNGATPIWLEFESPRVDFGSQALGLILFDGATPIGRVDFGNNSNIGYTMALYYKTRLTPSAGSHTYSWRGFLVAGTGTITVRFGVGGAGAFLPGFMRVSYA